VALRTDLQEEAAKIFREGWTERDGETVPEPSNLQLGNDAVNLDGTLCVNVCFNDKTLFSLRFACDISIVSADLSDWKTGNYEMIHEYMKPIPR